MIIHLLEAGIVVAAGYIVYKHYASAAIVADVKAAVTKAEATVATIKADLAKYL